MDPGSLRNRAFDCRLSPDWQQMAIVNTVSSDLWSAFIDCSERFRLPPVRYDQGAYFMLIKIVWSFHDKTLATIYLNLQTVSLSGLLWRCSPLLPCINGNEARGEWFVALRHVKFRWKVQLSAIETRQVSIVNTHKVYNNVLLRQCCVDPTKCKSKNEASVSAVLALFSWGSEGYIWLTILSK